MSLSPTITTLKAQRTNLEGYLADWIDKYGGQAHGIAGMHHLWEIVYSITTDSRPCVVICCNGEKSRGAFNQANTLHRVDRKWVIVLMRGHGFKNAMTEATADCEVPFDDVLEELREKLRVITWLTEEFPIDYSGWQPVPNLAPNRSANPFLDGAMIEFSTANDLPAVNTA